MKKIVLLLSCLACSYGMMAEEIIQIAPFHAVAGTTYAANNKKGFAINMTNGTVRPKALEFEFILPSGLAVATSRTGAFRMSSLSEERFSTYDEEEEEYVSYYSASCSLTDGVYKMLIVYGLEAPDDCAINGTEGEIITMYYTTTEDMAKGLYPIFVQNAKISYEDGSKGYLPNSSSYVTIGDYSPIATESHVDLSSLAGYVPSFVVDELNTELAGNEQLVSVGLSGATALGADLEVGENVLWCTSADATLNRTFKGGQWQTACLPFDVSEEQVAALKDAGCEIEQLSAYDEATNTVTFSAADAMTAHKPYIVKTTEAAVLFSGIEGATIDFTATPEDVTFGRVTMRGTYTPQTFDSDETQTFFAYDDADGAFVRIGRNLKVSPFRAYIVQQSKSAQSRMIVVHDNESGIPTGIESIASAKLQTGLKYNLQGQRVDTMKKGVYVVNGRKIIK